MVRTGRKTVTHTDVNKGAYLPNAEQRVVLQIAGFEPVHHDEERLIAIHNVGRGGILQTSYYASERVGSGRQPEPRMGRGLLERLHEGDELLLGTDGNQVFALVLDDITASDSDEQGEEEQEQPHAVISRTYRDVGIERIVSRARQSSMRVRSRQQTSRQYERDPAVREFALRRSGCKCEMPGCEWEGFIKVDGTLFIEAHHIKALGDSGDDSLENVAALCPNCHRRAHFAHNLDEIKDSLAGYIQQRNREFLEECGCAG